MNPTLKIWEKDGEIRPNIINPNKQAIADRLILNNKHIIKKASKKTDSI
jgi:hypothetical protein